MSLQPSLAHLMGRLAVVEARVKAAVERLRPSAVSNPENLMRGMYISDEMVHELLDGSSSTGANNSHADELLAKVEAAADAAEREGSDLRLRRLARTFRLDPIDMEFFLITIAPEIDPRFERLFGYLNDDLSKRRATASLALQLCGFTVLSEERRRLGPGGRLYDRLIEVLELERPLLTRQLRVSERVVRHLLGEDSVDPRLSSLICSPSLRIGDDPTMVVRALRGGVRLCYLQERPLADAMGLAAATWAELGADFIALDLSKLGPNLDPSELAKIAGREAALRSVGLLAGPVDTLLAWGTEAVRSLADVERPVILTGTKPWDSAWSKEVPFVTQVTAPSGDERAAFWRTSLNGSTPPTFDTEKTTRVFRLGPVQIERAAIAAEFTAMAEGRAIKSEDLKVGARLQNSAGLEKLSRRVQPAVGWDDLILPQVVESQLKELCASARNRELVLDGWGMRRESRGEGITALFAGPSGTGKTLAAEVIAADLGLDVYTIDLSTVVDKYIGETEKNLERVFSEAEGVNGVLFFDEADALFGKRSEVKDAHDRYANIEIAFLLQRMEFFEGLAILASNLGANIDEAFARRLDMAIDFPIPDQIQRLLIWERSLGSLVPRGHDLDLEFCARSFELTGGSIRNIALAAAHLAAEAGRTLSMDDLIHGTQREYRKLGRMCVEAEFGRYHALLSR